MSSTVFAHQSTSSHTSKSGASTSVLRVNRPNDAYELEADRVADRVDRGERVSGWSLKSMNMGAVQRQPASPPDTSGTPPSKPLSTSDMIQKVGEALLETKEGKAAVQAIKSDPLVKSTTDFLSTPAGIVIGGTAAVGVVSGLAAAHQPLPVQIPKIPLDFIHPGLGVKIDYQGPVDRPTAASITLSFTPKEAKKKKIDEAAAYRAETAQMAAQLQVFSDKSQDTAGLGPVAKPGLPFEQQWMLAHTPDYLKNIPAATAKAPALDAITGATPAAAPAAKMPANAPLKTPVAAPSKDAGAATSSITTKETKHAEEKPDEAVIQRKADVLTEEEITHAHGVEDVLRGPGRPLDANTRRLMESHIGFDFSKVRVFTGDRAAASARSLKARAYTVGSNVVFASGMYAPQTAAGRKLLAHELTHVVQQSPAATRKPAGISVVPRKVQRSDEEGPSFTSDPKGWALAKIRSIPGYDLFCTIIGKDLTTWRDKPNKKEDILREILKLVHGEEAYERISGSVAALDKAWEWLSNELSVRHLTLEDFKALVEQAIASVHVGDLLNIDAAVERVKAIFKPAYDSAIELAKLAFDKFFQIAVQVVMDTFGDLGQRVMGIINKVSSTFMAIARDPIKFVGNLIGALKLGFTNFADHFLQHLQDSLMDFLFGEVGAKIKPPKEFSIPAIFNLALEILELNYDKFRERLVAKTSPETVSFLEGTFDFIMKIASAKSLAGAWEIFKQQAATLINELVNSAVDTIKQWVLTKIVKAAIEKVLELFTPASAVIAAIEAIYHTIVTLIEKGKQLIAVLNAVVDSIARIVAGDLTQAADFIEGAMSRALNFLVSFLAEQAGIGDVGKTIRGFIHAVKEKVWRVIDKVIDWVVEKSKDLYERGKAGVVSALEWWKGKEPFDIDGDKHELSLEGDGDHPQVMVHSDTTPLEHLLDDVHADDKEKKQILGLASKLNWRQGELNKEKPDDSDKTGMKRFKELARLMSKIKSVKRAPKASPPKYGDLDTFGGGTRAEAYLSADHEVGTEPGGKDPPIWEDLTEELRSRKSYVRGHLLSMRLGGEGKWKNMMPLTNQANGDMERAVEGELKRAIGSGKRFFHYIVRAKYADSPKNPRTGEGAEKRLEELSWEVQPAIYTSGEWKEDKGPLLDDQDKKLDMNKTGSIDPKK